MRYVRARRYWVVAGLTLAAALMLSACGAGGSGGGYGTSGATSGAAGGSASATAAGVNLQCAAGATVCAKTVTVGGQPKTALADTQGMTLYYFTPDTATTIACTGACAQTWPPLAASGSNVKGTNLSGALTTLSGANGDQVVYNGHPLYRYAGDKAQTDATGEGIGGKWFVATPGLAAAGASSAPTTPATGPGGY